MPGPPARPWRRAASPRQARPPRVRRHPAATASGQRPASPSRRQIPPANRSAAATTTRLGGGRLGIGSPCCSAQSRARIGHRPRLQQRRQEQREAAGLHADRLEPGAQFGREHLVLRRSGSRRALRSAGAAGRAGQAPRTPARRQPAAAPGRREWRHRRSAAPGYAAARAGRRRGTRCPASGRAAAGRCRRAAVVRPERRPRSRRVPRSGRRRHRAPFPRG